MICQCGCGELVKVSESRKKDKSLPRYLPGHNLRKHRKPKKVTYDEPKPIAVKFAARLTPEQIDRIKREYHPRDRAYLAREMGINKTIFNFVVIELGLRKREA